jgi:hypothetical protein
MFLTKRDGLHRSSISNLFDDFVAGVPGVVHDLCNRAAVCWCNELEAVRLSKTIKLVRWTKRVILCGLELVSTWSGTVEDSAEVRISHGRSTGGCRSLRSIGWNLSRDLQLHRCRFLMVWVPHGKRQTVETVNDQHRSSQMKEAQNTHSNIVRPFVVRLQGFGKSMRSLKQRGFRDHHYWNRIEILVLYSKGWTWTMKHTKEDFYHSVSRLAIGQGQSHIPEAAENKESVF